MADKKATQYRKAVNTAEKKRRKAGVGIPMNPNDSARYVRKQRKARKSS